MLASIGVLVLALLIALLEVPALLRQKLKKDLVVFCLLLFVSTTLVIMRLLDIPLANPTNGLMAIFTPVSHWIDQLLK